MTPAKREGQLWRRFQAVARIMHGESVSITRPVNQRRMRCASLLRRISAQLHAHHQGGTP